MEQDKILCIHYNSKLYKKNLLIYINYLSLHYTKQKSLNYLISAKAFWYNMYYFQYLAIMVELNELD
jgi:hypothetical protein